MEFLAGPILAALAMFGFVVVADPQTVHLERITVPTELADQGYVPGVPEARLRDALLQMERDGRSFADSRALAADAEPTTLRLLAENMGLTPSLRAMQKATGKVAHAVSGDVVRKEDRLLLTLRVVSADGRSELRTASSEAGKPEELIQNGAESLLEAVDPYARAAWKFRKEFYVRGAEMSFPYSSFYLRAALQAKQSRIDPRWANNLLGVISQIEKAPDKALGYFQAALAVDPAFSPALVNRGVVLAALGRHREAIESYRKVLELPVCHACGPVHAAAYTWWGVSLAALGQAAASDQSFEYAIQAEPNYNDAYATWTSVLSLQRRTNDNADKALQRFPDRAIPLLFYPEYFTGVMAPNLAKMLKPDPAP